MRVSVRVSVRVRVKFRVKAGVDLLHLIENTFDRIHIYANPSSYPNPNSNPKVQLCFRTDEMTSFFDQAGVSVNTFSIKRVFDQV